MPEIPTSPTHSPPGAASLDLSLTLVQAATPELGCIAKFAVGVSGVAADVWPPGGNNGLVYLSLRTTAQWWNNANEAVPIVYMEDYEFYNEGTFTGIAITLPIEQTARQIHLYTGTVLTEPVSPADVGLVDADYPNTDVGITPYFRQLQLPASITITASLYRIWGSSDQFSWVLEHEETFELEAAAGCPGTAPDPAPASDPCGCDRWTRRIVSEASTWGARAACAASWRRRTCVPATETGDIVWDWSTTTGMDFSYTTGAVDFSSTALDT